MVFVVLSRPWSICEGVAWVAQLIDPQVGQFPYIRSIGGIRHM